MGGRVKKGGVYVDKTLLIRDLLEKGKVNLFAHPHRFGKTLALTMLKTFFEAKTDEAAENRKMQPRPYWANISSNSIVKELV